MEPDPRPEHETRGPDSYSWWVRASVGYALGIVVNVLVLILLPLSAFYFDQRTDGWWVLSFVLLHSVAFQWIYIVPLLFVLDRPMRYGLLTGAFHYIPLHYVLLFCAWGYALKHRQGLF